MTFHWIIIRCFYTVIRQTSCVTQFLVAMTMEGVRWDSKATVLSECFSHHSSQSNRIGRGWIKQISPPEPDLCNNPDISLPWCLHRRPFEEYFIFTINLKLSIITAHTVGKHLAAMYYCLVYPYFIGLLVIFFTLTGIPLYPGKTIVLIDKVVPE